MVYLKYGGKRYTALRGSLCRAGSGISNVVNDRLQGRQHMQCVFMCAGSRAGKVQ